MNNLESLETTLTLPSPCVVFKPNWPGSSNVNLWVKRDDAIHDVISGNKWRKLQNVLNSFSQSRIVSFGGAYSNHLHALGFACSQLGIPMTALVRGHQSATPSPMLQDLTNWHVDIEFVDRITYQQRDNKDYLETLRERFVDALIIPEGGSQLSAIQGIQTMMDEVHDKIHFDTIMAPVASGATLAGIVSALKPKQNALGVGVLKGEGYLESLVSQFLPSSNEQWNINHNFHFGGYAKVKPELLQFCETFNSLAPFKIEPVYSGKLFWALKDLLAQGFFADNANIVIVHTGGLQGAR